MKFNFNTYINNYVIFHESRKGPFLKYDSIFPKWNKKFASKIEIDTFKKLSLKVAKYN